MTSAPAARPKRPAPTERRKRSGQQVRDDERQHRSGGEREGDRQQRPHGLDQHERDPRTERLRGARQHRGPELLRPAESGVSHRDRDARALRNVLEGDRQDDEEAEPRGVRGVGGADREPLRQAVDEEHEEDERRQPHPGPAHLADVDIATAERELGDRQEGNAHREAQSRPPPWSPRPLPAGADPRSRPRS